MTGSFRTRNLVGIGNELARRRDFFRRTAALEIALDAVEDRRRDGDIAFIREAVADSADVVIDAKDFPDHNDCRLGWCGGVRPKGRPHLKWSQAAVCCPFLPGV